MKIFKKTFGEKDWNAKEEHISLVCFFYQFVKWCIFAKTQNHMKIILQKGSIFIYLSCVIDLWNNNFIIFSMRKKVVTFFIKHYSTFFL